MNSVPKKCLKNSVVIFLKILLINGKTIKKLLSDVSVLVTWPKWVHRHFQEAAENAFNWEKPYNFFDFFRKQKKNKTTILSMKLITKFVIIHFNQIYG